MIFAGIDIGSNAGRLLIASVHEIGGKTITEKTSLVRVPLRLGFDVFENGSISDDKVDFLLKTFGAYNNLIKVFQPEAVVACGTEAMREANNGIHVAQRIFDEKGIKLQIIDGDTEARIICNADNVNLHKPNEYSLYIDVGGGSTELSWFHNDELLEVKSFKVGTIRLLYDNIPRADWDELKSWVRSLDLKDKEVNCICSGGNINKLTKLFGNRSLNTLTYSQLSDAHTYLEGYSINDRIEQMGLRADRADVIVPAAIIFKKIMKWGELHSLSAPKIGLADGLIVDLYNNYLGNPTILSY